MLVFLRIVLFSEYLLLFVCPHVGQFGSSVDGHGVLDESVSAVER